MDKDSYVYTLVQDMCEGDESLERNVFGLVRMFVDEEVMFLPTKLVAFENRLMDIYDDDAVMTDFFLLLRELDMSYAVNGEFRNITNVMYPLIRKTNHAALGRYDSNGVRCSTIGHTSRGAFNYAVCKADGLLAMFFLFSLSSGPTKSMVYCGNKLLEAKTLVPMTGEIVGDKFVIQTGYHPRWSPSTVIIGRKLYTVLAPYYLGDNDVDRVECIASVDGVEYKFKDVPTVDVVIEEHDGAFDVMSGAEVIGQADGKSDAIITECTVDDNGAFKVVKPRFDKKVGQTAKEVRFILNSDRMDAVRKNFSSQIVYRAYYPDKYLLGYLSAKFDLMESRLVNAASFKEMLLEFDPDMSYDQIKRLSNLIGATSMRYVKFTTFPHVKLREVMPFQVIQCLKMMMPTLPHFACDRIANETDCVVDMSLLFEMAAKGDIDLYKNKFCTHRVGGNELSPAIVRPPDFIYALMRCIANNDWGGDFADRNVELMSVWNLFRQYYNVITVGDHDMWEKFFLVMHNQLPLQTLLERYANFCCVGYGNHTCSYGGAAHEIFFVHPNDDEGINYSSGRIKNTLISMVLSAYGRCHENGDLEKVVFSCTTPGLSNVDSNDYHELLLMYWMCSAFEAMFAIGIEERKQADQMIIGLAVNGLDEIIELRKQIIMLPNHPYVDAVEHRDKKWCW